MQLKQGSITEHRFGGLVVRSRPGDRQTQDRIPLSPWGRGGGWEGVRGGVRPRHTNYFKSGTLVADVLGSVLGLVGPVSYCVWMTKQVWSPARCSRAYNCPSRPIPDNLYSLYVAWTPSNQQTTATSLSSASLCKPSRWWLTALCP